MTDTDDPMNLLNLFATGAGVGLGVTAGGDILPDDFQDDPSQFLSRSVRKKYSVKAGRS